MSQKPETIFKRKLLTDLRAIPESHWMVIQQQAISGTPDVIGCIKGLFVALECKVRGNKATERQEFELKCLQAARGIALVVNEENKWDILKLLKKL